jgi:hypothetical protein
MPSSAAETFAKVLESLQPYPNMQFLLFTPRWGPLEATLLEYVERGEHSLLVYTMNESLERELPVSPRLRHHPYRVEQPRYNLRGRLYNHAFVLGLPGDEPESFARKVYTGIANAGGLYLLFEREDSALEDWEAALLRGNYVASSHIDLDEHSRMLVARKMHGWGG